MTQADACHEAEQKTRPEIKTHIPLDVGTELIINAGSSLGSGIGWQGSFILHCRRWNFELTISPAIAPFAEKDGAI